MSPCIVAARMTAPCDRCGRPATPVHMPRGQRGVYCEDCCPVCNFKETPPRQMGMKVQEKGPSQLTKRHLSGEHGESLTVSPGIGGQAVCREFVTMPRRALEPRNSANSSKFRFAASLPTAQRIARPAARSKSLALVFVGSRFTQAGDDSEERALRGTGATGSAGGLFRLDVRVR